jgi:hypothetical protein
MGMKPLSVLVLLGISWLAWSLTASSQESESTWKKHVIFEGNRSHTAVAGDFTKDGIVDVISNSANRTQLFVGPDWKEIVLDRTIGHNFIHSETFDVDGDGDLDYIGARYQPGLIVWLEQPERPQIDQWPLRIVSAELNGIHGVITGDVDQDGKLDLLATSAQPVDTRFPESLVWLKSPARLKEAKSWELFAFAKEDAPGLTHYLGFGDIDGDGYPDAATGAKGSPSPDGNYFAWWKAPVDARATWEKRIVSRGEVGATNIHPVELNGDGVMDLVASRGHGKGVLWFEGPDWKAHEIHPGIKEPHCLLATDMDEDGDIDAATCAFGSKEAWWYENDGKGGFTNHLVTKDQEAYDIRAYDIDLDGDLDLLIGGRGSNNVVWCENPRK